MDGVKVWDPGPWARYPAILCVRQKHRRRENEREREREGGGRGRGRGREI